MDPNKQPVKIKKIKKIKDRSRNWTSLSYSKENICKKFKVPAVTFHDRFLLLNFGTT